MEAAEPAAQQMVSLQCGERTALETLGWDSVRTRHRRVRAGPGNRGDAAPVQVRRLGAAAVPNPKISRQGEDFWDDARFLAGARRPGETTLNFVSFFCRE